MSFSIAAITNNNNNNKIAYFCNRWTDIAYGFNSTDADRKKCPSSCLNTIFVIWIIIDSIRMYQKIFSIVKFRPTVHCLCFENAHDSDIHHRDIYISLLSNAMQCNAICIYFYFPIKICFFFLLFGRRLHSKYLLLLCVYGKGFVTMDFH